MTNQWVCATCFNLSHHSARKLQSLAYLKLKTLRLYNKQRKKKHISKFISSSFDDLKISCNVLFCTFVGFLLFSSLTKRKSSEFCYKESINDSRLLLNHNECSYTCISLSSLYISLNLLYTLHIC